MTYKVFKIVIDNQIPTFYKKSYVTDGLTYANENLKNKSTKLKICSGTDNNKQKFRILYRYFPEQLTLLT